MSNSKWFLAMLIFFLSGAVFSLSNASLVSSFMADVTWNLRASEKESELEEIADELKNAIDEIADLDAEILERERRSRDIVSSPSIEECTKKANEIITNTMATLSTVNDKYHDILALTNKYREISGSVIRENDRLSRECGQVARVKRFYTYAFYTSLGLLLLFGLFVFLVWFPTTVLERKRKRLEIALMENTLRQQQTDTGAQTEKSREKKDE
jgi:hypothetical protein